MSAWHVISLFVFFSATVIRADSPLPPAKRYQVESPSKKFIATVDPKSGVTVQSAGAKESLWRAKRVWSRDSVLADDGEHFITGYNGLNLIPLDYTTNLVLITFWHRDRKIREVTVGDLFPNTHILRRTVSHYDWGHIQGIEDNILLVERCDRKKLRFDFRTGAIK